MSIVRSSRLSPGSWYRRLSVLALLLGTALVARAAAADEIAPRISLAGLHILVNHAPDGPSAFAFYIATMNEDGTFITPSVTGQLVTVTTSGGLITGHRIRFTRTTESGSESYVGAMGVLAGGNYWVAGELVRTGQRSVCRWYPYRCFSMITIEEPLPFIASVILPSG